MDFDFAARRLEKDQSRLRASGLKGRGRTGLAISDRARREAENRKKQQEKLRLERQEKKRQLNYATKYFVSCERQLGVRTLGNGGGVGLGMGMGGGVGLGMGGTTHRDNGTGGGGGGGGGVGVGVDVGVGVGVGVGGGVGKGLALRPTSIHGDGDKIALPPSVLERLTSQGSNAMDDLTSPWTFRIGILNPDYVFPQSDALRTLKPPRDGTDVDADVDVDVDIAMDEDDDDDDEDDETRLNTSTYLEELGHKYLAYSHGTVVEFTQEEGHVGLPLPIAEALLRGRFDGRAPDADANDATASVVPVFRTKDPATSAIPPSEGVTTDDDDDDNHHDNDNNQNTKTEAEEKDTIMEDEGGVGIGIGGHDRTPGHLAWGAFDLPDAPIEVSMVRLPKGKACTLVPTVDAIRGGFYKLKNIKLVMEQSLVRTRATLSLGDVVSTWHRGVQYDLTVADLVPPDFGAVACINTDIEVEFGPNDEFERQQQQQQKQQQQQQRWEPNTTTISNWIQSSDQTSTTTPHRHQQRQAEQAETGHVLGTGHTLSGGSTNGGTMNNQARQTTSDPTSVRELIPEPPVQQTADVCTVQIRGDGIAGKRRLDVNVATLRDLFAFASTLVKRDPTAFRLVTRFPRRILTVSERSLKDSGIDPGQELFLIENIG